MMKPEWFAGRLRELRASAGLTQQQLADAAGLKIGGIRDLEQRRTMPTWETVIALCEVLGVSPDAFVQKQSRKGEKRRGRPRKRVPEKKGTPKKKGGAEKESIVPEVTFSGGIALGVTLALCYVDANVGCLDDGVLKDVLKEILAKLKNFPQPVDLPHVIDWLKGGFSAFAGGVARNDAGSASKAERLVSLLNQAIVAWYMEDAGPTG